MEFSINALLTNFADDKLVAPKVLEKKLDCESETSLHQLQIVLDALEKIGILTKERGKYRRVPEEGLVEGKLRCSSKGFCFAIQEVEGSEDIYIRESQLSSAWNGDRVLVKVTKEGRRRRSPEGEVRLILERANSSVIARVKKTEQGYRAVPLDDRLLFELDLEPTAAVPNLDATQDQLVHVEIARYPLGSLPPVGQVKQILGSNAESAAEVDLVCCKYDLPQEFSESAQQAVAALPTKVRKADLQKRLDLREQLTISIVTAATDPLQDHALSLEQIAPDRWRLGVHSVDVAAYVPPDSPLDRQALRRGTYLHLDNKVLPLFPPALCQGLAALLPNQDRLAVSVLITLNGVGEVLEFEVQPTVIRVDHALDLNQAEAILERHHSEPQINLQGLEPAFELVDQLRSLGQALQQQRHQRGAFDQILPAQPRPIYPDQGLQGAVVVAPPWTVRTLVSECLVLANQLLISHLQALEVPVVYQTQPVPDVYEVQALLKLANNLGLELSLAAEDRVEPQDYEQFVKQFITTEVAPILLKLLHSTLKPVSYSLAPGPHFGLALAQSYGQATLPLRRYADLLNQRVLHAIFAEGRDRRTTRTKERVNLRHSSCHGQINWNVLPPDLHRDLETAVTTSVPQLNDRDKVIQQVYSDLEGLQKAKQMQARTGEIFRGLITRIESYGFFVVIEDPMVDGLVHVSSLKDDWYEYRSRQQTLIGRKNRKQYRLGDRVEVQVKSVDYYRQQIDLLVVGGGSEATGEDIDEPEEEDTAYDQPEFEEEE